MTLVIAVSIWAGIRYSDAAHISDEERFISLAKQFVGTFDNNPQSIESCQRSIRPDLGIVGSDLPEDVEKFRIEELDYTGYIIDDSTNSHLDILSRLDLVDRGARN